MPRTRPMRSALVVLLALVLAVNCVWAVQGLVAWRRGRGAGGSSEQLLLQRLNSTTLSVQVSRMGGDDKDKSTFVVNAHLVDSGGGQGGNSGGGGGGSNAQGQQQPQTKSGDRQQQQQQVQKRQVQDRQQGQPKGGQAAVLNARLDSSSSGMPDNAGLVSQLRGMGTMFNNAITATTQSAASRRAGSAAAAPAMAAPGPASEVSSPPPPPPHRAVLRMPEVEERSSDACAQVCVQLPAVLQLLAPPAKQPRLSMPLCWPRHCWHQSDQSPSTFLTFLLAFIALPPASPCRRCNCPRLPFCF